MKKTFEKPAVAKTDFEATAHLCIPCWYPPCTPPSEEPSMGAVSGGMTTNGGSGCEPTPQKKPCIFWWPWW